MNRFNIRMNVTEERINEFEDRTTENTQFEHQKENLLKNKMNGLRNLWDNGK